MARAGETAFSVATASANATGAVRTNKFQAALTATAVAVATAQKNGRATTPDGGLKVSVTGLAAGFNTSATSGVNYPHGLDVFNVPSSPETTPLASAGTSTRDHVTSHRDLGTAVEQLERYAAQLSHDHSGGTGGWSTPKLAQNNTHEYPDTDQSATSLHHTLGGGMYQAAPGNHAHDYAGPTITNKPYYLCTSQTHPVDVPLGTMLYESDTNRMRVWAEFKNNVSSRGMNYIETFPSTATSLTGYNQTYSVDSRYNGHIVVISPGLVGWSPQGSQRNQLIAIRTDPATRHTATDNQQLTLTLAQFIMSPPLAPSQSPTNDLYFRMSDDGSTYTRMAVGYNFVNVYATQSGWTNEVLIGSLSMPPQEPNDTYVGRVSGTSINVLRNNQLLGTVADAGAAMRVGSGYRGWGWGVCSQAQMVDLLGNVVPSGLGTLSPSEIVSVSVADYPLTYTKARWTLLPVAQVPRLRIKQTHPQKLSGSGSTIAFQSVEEDTFGFFQPGNSQTTINVSESGLYHVTASVQWDTQLCPDSATVGVFVNGASSHLVQVQQLKGTVTISTLFGQSNQGPGFAQTQRVSGLLRLAAGDVVTVRTSYTSITPIMNTILSWFTDQSPYQSGSWFNMAFLGV